MSIGDAEIKTQERVIRFFKDPEILGYQYIACRIIRIRTSRKIACASIFD